MEAFVWKIQFVNEISKIFNDSKAEILMDSDFRREEGTMIWSWYTSTSVVILNYSLFKCFFFTRI